MLRPPQGVPVAGLALGAPRDHGQPITPTAVAAVNDLTVQLADRAQHRHLLLVDLAVRVFVELHPVAGIADREAVQVRVRPPHGRLEDVMQLRQANARRHEDATPHRRLDIDHPINAFYEVRP